jgi:hypothetical protein
VMDTLFWMKVVVSPLVKPVPVLSLRIDTPCTDEFRAGMNRWLLEMFGEKEVVYMLGNNTVVMSPKHSAMLRQGASK